MEQIILYDGDNQFKLPHLKKNALMVRGMLPESPDVRDELRAKIESLDPTEIESVEDEEVVDLEPEVDVEAALIWKATRTAPASVCLFIAVVIVFAMA